MASHSENETVNGDASESNDAMHSSDHEYKPEDSKMPKRKRQETKSSNTIEDHAKKTKTAVAARVWSKEDEIAMLEGIIAYYSPTTNDHSVSLCSYLKKSIFGGVSKKQIQHKIRRLKKVFRVNSGKAGDLTFSDPHKERLFRLSKEAWGAQEEEEEEEKKEHGSGAGDLYYEIFYEYCAQKGLDIKFLEEAEKRELWNFWCEHYKEFSTLNLIVEERMYQTFHKYPVVKPRFI